MTQIREETPGAGKGFILGIDRMIDAAGTGLDVGPPSSCLVEILTKPLHYPADLRQTSPSSWS